MGGVRLDFGINFNGDVSINKIKEGVRASENAGFSHIWVGENAGFLHSFPIMVACLEYTEKIKVGSGIISARRNRPFHIKKHFKTLEEAYGPRVIAGLAPGDKNSLLFDCMDTRDILKTMKNAVEGLKKSSPEIPVFIGASGPKLLKLASKVADGVLLNYVHPDYVEWALKYLKKDIYKAVYGPALLSPKKEFEEELRASSAIVIAGSNSEFLREMELLDLTLDIQRIVENRRWGDLKIHSEVLLERFTIFGNLKDITKRIEAYQNLGIDQVIFGSPFWKSTQGIKKMREIISSSPR